MKNEDTIKVIEAMHADMKALIEMNQKLVAAEIGAVQDVMKIEFRIVKEKQDHSNGCLSEHDKKIKDIEEDIKPQHWAKRHWKAAVLILFAGTYALYTIYELFTFGEIIKALK